MYLGTTITIHRKIPKKCAKKMSLLITIPFAASRFKTTVLPLAHRYIFICCKSNSETKRAK